MSSAFFYVFVSLIMNSLGEYQLPFFCNIPPPQTLIPFRIDELPNESTWYFHAIVNAKKAVFDVKYLKASLIRSPYNNALGTAHISQQDARTGDFSSRIEEVTELCPGVWEFRDKNNRGNFNINFKLWGNVQMLVDTWWIYQDGRYFDEVSVFLSRQRRVRPEDVERAFEDAKIRIRSLQAISQNNCGDHRGFVPYHQ